MTSSCRPVLPKVSELVSYLPQDSMQASRPVVPLVAAIHLLSERGAYVMNVQNRI
jgi:hypothetical protein